MRRPKSNYLRRSISQKLQRKIKTRKGMSQEEIQQESIEEGRRKFALKNP